MKLGLYSHRKKSCGTNGHKCIGRNLETRTQDTSIVGRLIYFGEIELLNSRMTMVGCARKLILFLSCFSTITRTSSFPLTRVKLKQLYNSLHGWWPHIWILSWLEFLLGLKWMHSLKHMVPLKAPRLDGMTPIFFKLLN